MKDVPGTPTNRLRSCELELAKGALLPALGVLLRYERILKHNDGLLT